MEKDQGFQLVFEGVQDNSPETLRRLKSAMIADLNFSVAEVQEFLNSAPLTIKRADNESDLSVAFKTLQGAGGKVLILSPASVDAGSSQTPNQSAPDENTVKPTVAVQPLPIAFEFDTGETSPAPKPTTPAQATPTLPSDNAPLFEFSTEAPNKSGPSLFEEFKQQAKSPAPVPTPQPEATSLFSLDDLTLAKETETKPLVERNAAPSPQAEQDSDLTLGAVDENPQPKVTPKQTPATPSAGEFSLSLDAPAPVEASPAEKTAEASVEEAPSMEKQENKEEEYTPSLAELQARAREKKGEKQDQRIEGDEQETEQQVEEDDYSQQEFEGTRKGFLSKIPWDLALPLGIGLTVLIGYNLFNYMTREEPSLPNISIPTSEPPTKVVKQLKPEAKTPAKVESKPAEIVKLYGDNEYAEMKVSWHLDVDGAAVTNPSFNITTPRPPERTADEVVHNIPPKPWLYKLEIDELAFDLKPDGSFSASGPARAYIEAEAQRNRVVANASFVGRMNVAKHELTGELTIKRGIESAPQGKSVEVTLNGTDANIFMTTVIATEQDSGN